MGHPGIVVPFEFGLSGFVVSHPSQKARRMWHPPEVGRLASSPPLRGDGELARWRLQGLYPRQEAQAWLLASGAGWDDHPELFALDERVGRVLDDLIAGAEAGDDLHGGAVVLADDDGNQMGDVVAV